MVYVDDMEAPFGPMRMCHMIADSTVELLQMASKIGVHHLWIQYPGHPKEHFDICLSKKKLAIAAGAVPVSRLELTWMIHKRTCEDPQCRLCGAFNRLVFREKHPAGKQTELL